MKRVGLSILSIILKLSNYSDISADRSPNFSRATFLMDVYALISITAPGLLVDAKWHVGPDPMDLPKSMISLSLISLTLAKMKSKICSESSRSYLDEHFRIFALALFGSSVLLPILLYRPYPGYSGASTFTRAHWRMQSRRG